MLVDQLAQHRDEDVDRVGGRPGRIAEHAAVSRADRRVKRAVHLRAAVDQVKNGFGGHQITRNYRGTENTEPKQRITCIVRSVPLWLRRKFCTISPGMTRTWRSVAIALAAVAAVMLTGCVGASGLFRQYEYEEEIYLSLDGTATVYVNSSVPALDALRGATLDTSPAARVDRDAVRAFYSSPSRVSGRSISRAASDVGSSTCGSTWTTSPGSARRRRFTGRRTASAAKAIGTCFSSR